MGTQTRANLVSEALLIAGNPTLTARANLALNRQLRRTYMSWPWPFLVKRAKIDMAAGSQGTLFGGGNGGVTLEVQRVIDPIFLYTADYSTQARPRVVPITGGNLIGDESINNPATFIGQPQQFKVRSSGTWGVWQIVPLPFPDKAYKLAIDYIVQPADIPVDSSGDNTTPTYPNDETIIQMILYEALLFMSAGSNDLTAANDALTKLNSMTVNDRMRFGYSPGTNDQIGLDPGMFNAQVTPIVK